jgi:hypothetical protein
MKRFLILLVVAAAGLAAAALTVPSNAATVNGTAISQNQLNSDVTAIANSPDYQCYLNAQEYLESEGKASLQQLEGAGTVTAPGQHTTATSGFVSVYLDTVIGQQLVLNLAAAHHVEVTPADLATARSGLSQRITGVMSELAQTAEASVRALSCGASPALTGPVVLASLPSSFVAQTVHLNAIFDQLQYVLGGIGPTTADLQKYYVAHIGLFDTDCFSVASFTSSSTAEAAEAKIVAGSSFASVGGSAQGCEVLYGVISELPATADLQALPLHTVSAPVASGSDYYLIEITSRSLTAFAKAKEDVQAAAQDANAATTQADIYAGEKRAVVTVDPRYGTWISKDALVVAPVSPRSDNVLNTAANAPPSVTSSSPFESTPASGQSG